MAKPKFCVFSTRANARANLPQGHVDDLDPRPRGCFGRKQALKYARKLAKEKAFVKVLDAKTDVVVRRYGPSWF
jgi:hypothetical protein